MFFKEAMRKKIEEGKKTVTRRPWSRPMAKVGGIYQVRITQYKKGYHFLIKVLDLKKQKLGDMTLEDAKAEGFESIKEFGDYWTKINGFYDRNEEVTVITFRKCTQEETDEYDRNKRIGNSAK